MEEEHHIIHKEEHHMDTHTSTDKQKVKEEEC
jgi:hypothetical protein